MRTTILLPAFLLALAVTRPAQAARHVSSPLVDFVAEMRVFMPGEGSGGFVVPTPEEQEAFRAAARALVAGDIATAERALAIFPGVFEVLDYTDGPGGPAYLAIAEVPGGPTGLLPRGWGFYFFARAPKRPGLVIEAPHPVADRESEVDAASAVSALRPAAFLLAGSHRYADPKPVSDMAHTSSSVFEPVHEVALEGGGVAMQIHGFSLAAHAGYPDLLLSSGDVTPTPDVVAICAEVNQGGPSCVPFDGSAFITLGGLQNVQGSHAATLFGPGHFMHFEIADVARQDPARFGVIVKAIADQTPTTVGCTCGSGPASPSLFLGLVALGLYGARPSSRSRRHT
jgi:MYXO-CTERM domain-containing protein